MKNRGLEQELYNEHEQILIPYENIFHDLKTPLSVMYMNLQMLEKGGKLTGTSKNYMKNIKKNWFKVMKLIHDASDSKKIMEGSLLPTLRNYDVVQLMKKVVDSAQLLAIRKNIDFSYQCSCDSLVMATDKEIVERIILNMLSNAFQRTPTGGKVHLFADIFKNNTIQIEVVDSGGETDTQVFQVKKRKDSANQMIPKGSMWFFVVKQLVQLLGGKIKPLAVTDGLKITVHLPIAQIEEQGQEWIAHDEFYNENIYQIELSDNLF